MSNVIDVISDRINIFGMVIYKSGIWCLSIRNYGLWAKSQILSSVAPSGRKSWLLYSVRDMSSNNRNPCFTKFSEVNFL